jgi:SPP1 family predicted phage head-tail adaptor
MMSGRLDRKITLQRPTTTTDDYGETITTWEDYRDVWADLSKQSGREMFEAGKLAEVDAVFKVRYLSQITREWRVKYDGQEYDITGLKEIGRKDGLEIAATARM